MKPFESVFAVNSLGRIFCLEFNGNTWKELPYLGVDFKRVSASKNYLWALGGDHQLYVRVFGLEIPVRVKEEVYENQRWNPIDGFSDRLLPTDRPHFSNADGTIEKTKESIHLPSMAWQWESVWYVDNQLNGTTLEQDGWTYAVDFPAEYSSKKAYTSCVRRRKWIRYRKYVAVDSWSIIKSINRDPVEEPFIDVSVGGYDLRNGSPDECLVWTVTVQGNIYVRQGVRSNCPEGTGWLHIPTPEMCEASLISVGPTGMIWAVTWLGKALVRLGISRQNPYGINWAIIDEPSSCSSLSQVSVGESSVWALTRDHKIWFRQGLHRHGTAENDALYTGTKWIEMVGHLQTISHGIGDQLLGIGYPDQDDDMDRYTIVWRTGITSSDLSGKSWRIVSASIQPLTQEEGNHPISRLATSPSNPNFKSEETDSQQNRIIGFPVFQHWVWVTAGSCKIDPVSPPLGWFAKSERKPSVSSKAFEPWKMNILQQLKSLNESTRSAAFQDYEPAVEKATWIRKTEAKISLGKSAIGRIWEDCQIELEQTGSTINEVEFGTLSINGASKNVKDYISMSEITALTQQGDKTLAIFTSLRSVYLKPTLIKFTEDVEMETWQAHISKGMNCLRQTQSTPSATSIFSVTNQGEVCVFDPIAAERADETGAVQLLQDDVKYTQEISIVNLPYLFPLQNGFGPGSQLLFEMKILKYADRFSINLQVGKSSDDSDIALHFNPRFHSQKVILNSRKCGEWGMEEYKSMIVIKDDLPVKAFTPGQSVQILFKCEPDYFQLYANGCEFGRFNHRFNPEDITHFRIFGDINAGSSATYHSNSVIIPQTDMYWRILGGGHLKKVESSLGVAWAISNNKIPWIYTSGWGGSHFKGVESSNFGINTVEDVTFMYVYENQRWNPLSGFTAHGLPTDRYSWSDETGMKSLSKTSMKLPNIHWQWVNDWNADFDTPGGVDQEGWQYATDFPASYHGKTGLTDYVRRRRWFRECKINATGPWKQLCTTKLLDVSMMASSNGNLVHVWAVSSEGCVLYRDKVTAHEPSGRDWITISHDITCKAIAIGKGSPSHYKVWVVGQDGSVYLRKGVSDTDPIGTSWKQLQRDTNRIPIKCISAGDSDFLWCVDTYGKLYFREGITEKNEEASQWTNIPVTSFSSHFSASEVVCISAAGKELWAVLNNVTVMSTSDAGVAGHLEFSSGITTPVDGVLVRMMGVTSSNPTGTGFEVVIGGGWSHISIKGRQK